MPFTKLTIWRLTFNMVLNIPTCNYRGWRQRIGVRFSAIWAGSGNWWGSPKSLQFNPWYFNEDKLCECSGYHFRFLCYHIGSFLSHLFGCLFNFYRLIKFLISDPYLNVLVYVHSLAITKVLVTLDETNWPITFPGYYYTTLKIGGYLPDLG